MEYDQLVPFQIVEEALNFRFITYRYEEWSNGKLQRKGNIMANIVCIPVFFDDKKSEITFRNIPKELNIHETLIFDLTFTGKDRIFLATIPQKTNIESYNTFGVFKSSVPLGFPIITREEREFDENEPFACSIFLQNDEISKISFSFGNNPRLIEFYSDKIISTSKNKEIAKFILELFIEDLEDGGGLLSSNDNDSALVSETYVIKEIEEKFGYKPTKEQILSAIEYVNSKYDEEIISIDDSDFFSSIAYTTEYSKKELKIIISNLD